MNTNTMRYVIAVAEEGNFTRAAQRLYISQPSLSQNIRALETQLGTPVFDRSTNPVRLTHAGEVFLEWARRVVESESQTVRRIDDIAGSRKRKLIVGVSPYRSLHLLPEVLERFYRATEGNCSVTLVEQRSSEYMKAMEEGKLDLLIDRPSGNNLDYETVPLAEEFIFLAVPESCPVDESMIIPGKGGAIRRAGISMRGIGETESISVKNVGIENVDMENLSMESSGAEQVLSYDMIDPVWLKDQPVIMLSERQHMGRLWRSVFDQIGEVPNMVMECQSVEMAYRMALKGLGMTLIPELLVHHMPGADRMRYLVLKDFRLSRTMAVIYPKKRYLSRDAGLFIRLLQESMS